MDKTKAYGTENLYDVIVIGGGPAGLTAALYLARARYRVLVVEKEAFGGQITITHEVVNYPGITKVSGKSLTDTMRFQAEAFGAEFLLAEALSLDVGDDVKTVHTNRGDFYCLGILIATGAHPRSVGFQGEDAHKGHGVAYCATCDGEFFTGKEIYVIGGGYAAAEESVFLTKFARHVTVLIRGNDFSCAASVADQARNHEKITVLTNTVVEEVSGENGLDYIRYRNKNTDKITEYHAENGDTFGVFVFAGYSPDTALIQNLVQLNAQGYVITDASQKTSVEGIYAAGDVCIKPLRQVVTATSDGALAATELEKYVVELQQKTGLHPKPPVTKTPPQPSPTESALSTADAAETFTAEMKAQLDTVFSKMQRKLVLKLYLDNRPISTELEEFMDNLAELSEMLTVEVATKNDTENHPPCVQVYLEDGSYTGIAFHGVPGGHEFTSFMLGLYNASGPGQKIEDDILAEVKEIQTQIEMKILVSLSCTMCPDLVIACQRIAAENPHISAEVYDLQHFEDLKKRYNVMSVPCLVINDDQVSFGKKNIGQVIEFIKEV